MTTWKKAVLRPLYAIACSDFGLRTSAPKTLLTAVVVTIMLSGVDGQAYASLPPYVVSDDRGGSIVERLREIDRLRASGQSIEIRGALCYSTCTMFLGLAQTCISPNTMFGFHGPSRSGVRLKADEFEHYSQLIARHYPKPLRDWFMRKGRKRIKGVHRIKGSEIIRMGVRGC